MVSSLYDSSFSAKTSVMSSKVILNRNSHTFAIAPIRLQPTNSTTSPFYTLLKGQQEAPVAGAVLESDTGDTMHQRSSPMKDYGVCSPDSFIATTSYLG